jgi:purine nucleosidase
MRKIIIDSDAGSDDAVGILLAMRHPNTEVAAFLSVFGNVNQTQATANLLLMSQLFSNGKVPVYPGAKHPLIGQFKESTWHGHGSNGLGGAEFSEQEASLAQRPSAQSELAASALIRMLQAEPGTIDVIAIVCRRTLC